MTSPVSAQIPRRRLGAAGPEVSALGLGCMGMSDFYGTADDAQSLAVLHHALDIGINFLDTADMYGVGANERLPGPLLATRRAGLLAQGEGIVPIPGTRSVTRLDENAAAGTRYPAAQMGGVNV